MFASFWFNAYFVLCNCTCCDALGCAFTVGFYGQQIYEHCVICRFISNMHYSSSVRVKDTQMDAHLLVENQREVSEWIFEKVIFIEKILNTWKFN